MEQDDSVFNMVDNATNLNDYFNETFDESNRTFNTPAPHENGTVPALKKYDFMNPFWNVAFSSTVFTGTTGNLIVLWIVLGEPL